jgi:TonB family protein
MPRSAAALFALLLTGPCSAAPAGETLPDVPLQAWVTLDATGRIEEIDWERPAQTELQTGAEPLLRALRFSAPAPGTAGVRTHVDSMLMLQPEGEDVVLHLYEPGAGPKLRRILPPRYPGNALRGRLEGYVVAIFQVDPAGEPATIRLLPGPGSEAFEPAVRGALRQWRFEPEQRGGAPITSTVCAPFRFTIAGRTGEPETQPCPALEDRVAVAGEVRPLPEIEVTASRARGVPGGR